MGRVFVPVDPGDKNLSPAERFGELTHIHKGQLQLWAHPELFQARLGEALRKFGDKDFLLLIGDPVICAMAFAIAAVYNGGRVKVLKWDRRLADYAMIQLDLRTLELEQKGVNSGR